MSLLEAIGINRSNRLEIRSVAKQLEIKTKELDYYENNNILPNSLLLKKIENIFGINPIEIKINMGIIDKELQDYLKLNSKKISKLKKPVRKRKKEKQLSPKFSTESGELFNHDCLRVMRQMESNSVDVFFADPPFNLDKFYLSEIDDNLSVENYLNWCYEWIDEGIRILKPGGSFFLWNIPKWNTHLSAYLSKKLNFRHWIASDIKLSLRIAGKLYPSHYSLLYYIKGERPNVFNPDRLPMEICRKCTGDIKDYGGYKNKMNPLGINMTDIWYDIPPVRHSKYKTRKEANELSIKLMDRIIEMSSNEGDTIFDPFGGAGTTFIVSEIKNRKWKGCELGPVNGIIDRFENILEETSYLSSHRSNYNTLFIDSVKKKRKKLGLWTDETFSKDGKEENDYKKKTQVNSRTKS